LAATNGTGSGSTGSGTNSSPSFATGVVDPLDAGANGSSGSGSPNASDKPLDAAFQDFAQIAESLK
jgi:hypothetical protein